MSSDGLESIALAVAHLEGKHRNIPPTTAGIAAPSSSMFPQPMAPNMPRGSSISESPRIVSADMPESPSNTPPVAASRTETPSGVRRPAADFSSPPPTESSSVGSTSQRAPVEVVNGVSSETSTTTAPETPTIMAQPASSCPKKKMIDRHTYRGPSALKDLEPYFEPTYFEPSLASAQPSKERFEVGPDDVIFGRGGSSNHHSGNIQYRQLVKSCQQAYLAAKRCDKPRIAAGIVMAVRKVGGRFLKKDTSLSSGWKDVGNLRAREKTSQALREGAPELREAESTYKRLAQSVSPVESNKKKEAKRAAPPKRVPHVIDAALVMNNLEASGLEPPRKKQLVERRSSLESLAAAAALSPVPQQVSQRPAPPVVVGPYTAIVQAIRTVSSGDDEYDSASSAGSGSVGSKSGPRVKFLKGRLQTQDAAATLKP